MGLPSWWDDDVAASRGAAEVAEKLELGQRRQGWVDISRGAGQGGESVAAIGDLAEEVAQAHRQVR